MCLSHLKPIISPTLASHEISNSSPTRLFNPEDFILPGYNVWLITLQACFVAATITSFPTIILSAETKAWRKSLLKKSNFTWSAVIARYLLALLEANRGFLCPTAKGFPCKVVRYVCSHLLAFDTLACLSSLIATIAIASYSLTLPFGPWKRPNNCFFLLQFST